MIARSLCEILEAGGYLQIRQPMRGVYLKQEARFKCQARDFTPDVLRRIESALMVHFKLEPEAPPTGRCHVGARKSGIRISPRCYEKFREIGLISKTASVVRVGQRMRPLLTGRVRLIEPESSWR